METSDLLEGPNSLIILTPLKKKSVERMDWGGILIHPHLDSKGGTMGKIFKCTLPSNEVNCVSLQEMCGRCLPRMVSE